MKKIYFAITNDITYDQRMHRICKSLAEHGYDVVLVGVRRQDSTPLEKQSFRQKRMRLIFQKGKLFYAEYMTRLFFYLLSKKMDAICAIDLDTITPCLAISRLKKIKRVYDAHELFTELKEVATRPRIQQAWLKIEKKTVPHFLQGYTVSQQVADELYRRYQVKYEVIRNITVLEKKMPLQQRENFILYQGAVNEARGFEYLVPAMHRVPVKLVICGDGNFMPQLKALIAAEGLTDKITLMGMLSPGRLMEITQRAMIGLALIENSGRNQYFSLANKFFDYIHAGLPQITMNFPEYRAINGQYEVALLLDGVEPEKIAASINNLLEDGVLYERLRQNCLLARQRLNWQQEEKKLLQFYEQLFNT